MEIHDDLNKSIGQLKGNNDTPFIPHAVYSPLTALPKVGIINKRI